VERSETALARAFARIQGALRTYVGLPLALQLSLAAAGVVIIGSLAPWVDSDDFLTSYVAGIDTNVGELTFVTAVVAIVLTILLISRRRNDDSGALVGLGLLAALLVVIDIIRIHDVHRSIGWGLYVTAIGAAGLLLAGLLLLGGRSESLGPPD
jgi:hypothetical protein